MAILLETHLGQKDTELYITYTEDGRVIVAIPTIHWSAELNISDDDMQKNEYIQASLHYHMYEGDIMSLADKILEHTAKC
ncbi:YueH family protein [Niallia taxi]|nr:YueH family protein [Niallia taxi]MCM3214522.1 YueH family protein [Niallia taxi]MCT2346355.1 YueH family protein [Niallia taxi]MDE5051714.1 YueH family protein [Niallia taxi]MDK8643555.1 YueH family protein [Niallia taxi]MED3964988.1 YueH family protein [Niallia taxi]